MGLFQKESDIRGLHFDQGEGILFLNLLKKTPESLPGHLLPREINDPFRITDDSLKDGPAPARMRNDQD
jgi:hypothetical protein